MELYKLTYAEAAETAIEKISEQLRVSKAEATVLFKNALLYNVVITEIVDQARYLQEET